jgi:hypothetical protein
LYAKPKTAIFKGFVVEKGVFSEYQDTNLTLGGWPLLW